MGNVLDCSTDPLDQIHEPDGNQPTEVGPTGSDDARSQSSSYQGSIVGGGGRGGDRRSLDGAERPSGQQPPRPEVLYLEKGVPLRDSIMWKLQREYYTAHHVQCWERMVVPCFVTSNSFIARAYARVLVGFMRDWFLFSAEADQSEPILVLEVGAGHGKFSCLVLQHLLDMREFLPTLSPRTGSGGGSAEPEKAEPGNAESESAGGGDTEQERQQRATDDGKGGGGGEGEGEGEGEGASLSAGEAVGAGSGSGSGPGSGSGSGAADGAGGSATLPGSRTKAAGSGSGARGGQAWQEVGAADGLPFRYVVTDVAQGTLDYVRSHPSMQTFLSEGILEVALLDAEDADPPSELLLQVSGQKVDLKSVKNPVATVCNYVFDSLRQDAFRVKDNTLYENRVTITATTPLPQDLSQLSLTALKGLALRWEHRQHKVTADRARAYYAGAAAEAEASMVRERDRERESAPSPLPGSAQDGEDAEEAEAAAAAGAPPPADDRAAEESVASEAGPSAEELELAGPTSRVSVGEGEEEGGDAGGGTDGEQQHEEEGGVGAVSNGGPTTKSDSPALEPDEGARGGGGGGGGGTAEGQGGGVSDADFDDLLASYLGGSSGADGGEGGEGEGERAPGGTFGKAGGSLLMPLGALRLLRHLSSLSGGRGLVLVGDKGYVSAEEMKGDRDPHIAYHGSLSCMVNMDALRRYTRNNQRGGWALSSPYMEGFKCQALAFGTGMGETDLQETRLAFQDSTQAFGPESFSTLQRSVKDDVAHPSLGLVVQLLRLSRLDPDVYVKFRGTLVDQVSSQELPPPIWEDLKKDTAAIAQQCYPLQQGKDVNFEAARLLMALKDFEAALALFRRSDSVSGEHHMTCHNMGMSYFYLGKLKEAKDCFERSLELDETYEDSARWLAHVERSMVPPSLAAATAAARPSVAELRDAGATGADGSADSSSSRTAAGLVDVNLNTLSI